MSVKAKQTPKKSSQNKWWLILGIALVSLALYWPAMSGDFIYDDNRLIVKNHLIQEGQFLGEALTSDVWAFKGNREEAWSNYWRPGYVVWLSINYQLFGAESSFPWHLSSHILHLIVLVLLFALLVKMGLSRNLGYCIVLLYAVHPVLVENLSWIAAVTDPLLAVFFLGSIYSFLSYLDRGLKSWYILCFVLVFLSMMVKEVGIMLPVLFFCIVLFRDKGINKASIVKATKLSSPFLLLALIYFYTRFEILGAVTKAGIQDYSLIEVLVTAPSIFTFYLRQAILPFWIEPAYPLTPVTLDSLEFANFVLPIIVCGLFVFVAFQLIKRGEFVQKVGLLLMVLPLLPTFNINAFIPGQIVHDRYLYLSLMGILAIIIPYLKSQLDRRKVSTSLGLGLIAFVVLLLSWQTRKEIPTWNSELSLWETSIKSDPSSAFNWLQYGVALFESGDNDAALRSFSKSIAISPMQNALFGRADVYLDQKNYAAAEQDMKTVLKHDKSSKDAYERLAKTYEAGGRLQHAESVVSQAISSVPGHRCAFTTDLAIIKYRLQNKEEAWTLLTQARQMIPSEPTFKCYLSLFFLASLNQENGNIEEARNLLNEFLLLISRKSDQFSKQYRERSQDLLRSMSSQ